MALAIAQRNLHRCGAGAVQVQLIPWESAASLVRSQYQAVLFADAVYTEEAARSLAKCIHHCLSPEDTAEVHGAFSPRRVGVPVFLAAMTRLGFAAVRLPLQEQKNLVSVVDGWTREAPVREGDEVVLIRWKRGGRDHAGELGLQFDSALGVAERSVDRVNFERSGYLPEE
jgi:hypothetical protein